MMLLRAIAHGMMGWALLAMVLPARGTTLAVTVDFPDDVTQGPFDAARLAALMSTIRQLGATRVNWLYYGSNTPNDPGRGNIWWSHWAKYGPSSIEALGEPLRAAVAAAHHEGLEIYGVLKPYNGGISGSYPTGSPEAGSTSHLTKIGGTLQQVIPFLEEHPEMRIQRRPDPETAIAAEPIREIRLIKADDRPTRLRPEQIRLWVSDDNYRYQPLKLVPQGAVTVEPSAREVRDYRGNLVTARGAPVRIIRLVDLDLRAKFVVVTTTLAAGAGDFLNTPLGLIELRGEGGRPLAHVVASSGALWIRPRDFRTYGLEFDMGYGHLPVALDAPWHGPEADPWKPYSGKDEFGQEALFGNGPAGGFVGFARGSNEFLPAAPCEAYPEVRALWLGWVRSMLEAGVDGVNLRISAHGTLSDEPEAYGWNPPVLAAYRARFGDGPIESARLAQIRGDFYSQFVQGASGLVRARGKKLQLTLHAEAFRPHPVFGQQNGLPANLDFQWRRWIEAGWADEAYLRTSWFEAAEDPLSGGTARRSRLSEALADPVAAEMIAVANAHHLPLMLNRYIGRAAGLEEYLGDLTQIAGDRRFAGFDVYEFFDLAQANAAQPGFLLKQGRLEALAKRWRELQASARPADRP